jgi:tRNA U34 5-methylaminomethyl-2-thiouridine-forming methyltransferase MnmC
MNEPDTGLQQPRPVAPPEYVPEMAVLPIVAVPEADPEQGTVKYRVNLADLPLISPATVPPPRPGMRAVKVQPV